MLGNTLNTAGRILLALYFLLPGIMKFVSWEAHIGLMEKHGMPMVSVLLALAGVIQIGASICLLLNRYVLACALGLAMMTLLININLHDFWNYSGLEAAHETQNFVKNLGIFAGLLLLASIGYNKQQP
ncbi:MAG: DoxX family protein [Pseudomonadales bacterium]